MTSLALTMIVRDEADQLPSFLQHHAGLADELVVVDTGSGDNTAEIASRAGARVVAHFWQDDFSAARNAGLDAVTARWVLFLDADERVSRRDFALLREGLAAPPDRVYLQETWNYCLGTAHLEWQPLPGRYPEEEAGQTGMFVARRIGVFPRDERLRFAGRVHESVLPAVTATGLAVTPLAVPVHHYGYARSAQVNADRAARYRHLVRLKHADDPADPAAQLELATVLLESGQPEAAVSQLEILVRGPAGLRPVVRGLVLLGRLRREQGQPEAARKLLDEAVSQDPDFVFAWLERIRVETQQADWPAAQGLLSAAEARFGGHQPQLLREGLLITIQTGRLSEARAIAAELIRFCPQWQDIRELQARLQSLTKPTGEA